MRSRSLRLASAIVIGFFAAAVLSAAPAQLSSARIGDIDAMVETLRAAGGIPGLAFALVEGSSPRLVKGYGRRSLESADAVGPRTLFAIASLTKAFTSTSLALQVREGRLGWDDLVVRYLPAFRTSDEWVTAHATIRDFLSMRMGWQKAEAPVFDCPTLKDLLAVIPGLAVGEFRGTHEEGGNVSYVLAGQVLEAVSGMTWERFVTTRLLEPLGMKMTVTQQAVPASGDVAAAHLKDPKGTGTIREIRVPTHVYPAGGLYSNAEDLARWITFQLDTSRGLASVPQDNTILEEPHRPRILIGPHYQAVTQTPGSPAAYGMGWIVYGYRGTRILEHAGSLNGFTSYLVLLPERRLGFVMLANIDPDTALPTVRALRNRLLDALIAER